MSTHINKKLATAISRLNAVHQMVDQKRYCIDILDELKRIQRLLDEAAADILKHHLESCVLEAVNSGNAAKAIDEMVTIFNKSTKLYR